MGSAPRIGASRLQPLLRSAAVDGRAGGADPGRNGIGAPGDVERETALQRQRSAVRTAIARIEYRIERRQIGRRIAACEIRRFARRQAEFARIDVVAAIVAARHVEGDERADGSRLVPARGAVHHPRALDRHPGQGLRHEQSGGLIVRTDQMKARRRGIGERPEQIEHRAHPERGADRRERLHRRMKIGSEEKREPGRLEALRRALLIERQREAEPLDQIGAAAAARDGTIAVLHHRQAACRREERGTGRQIQAAGRIAARADDIDGIGGRGKRRLARERAHGAGKSANLGGRHSLGAQCREQRTGHGGGEIGHRQHLEQRSRLHFAEIAALQQLLEGLTGSLHRGAVGQVFRKLPIKTGPSGVSTLSGWNCTPSIGSDLWRTPMISPSAVRAVTSSTSGMLEGSAISEW